MLATYLRVFLCEDIRTLLPSSLSEADQQRYESISDPHRARSFAATRAMLEQALIFTGSPWRATDLLYSAVGKPFLPGLEMSFSHSQKAAAVVLCERPCGLDLEYRYPKNSLRLAQRFFAPAEALQLQQSAKPDQDFQALWSLKEASYKCLNLSFQREWTQFYFDQQKRLVSNQAVDRKFAWALLQTEEFSLALCCESRAPLQLDYYLWQEQQWHLQPAAWQLFTQQSSGTV